ncbi:MAG: NYN domain-containing protein [Nitrospira sp.]|nr:NYN domain-containing protein [Nitrospira sp.]
MDRVFIYWDNSNIYISAKEIAAEREGGDARYRVRLDFPNLLRLACADRPIESAVAVGSIPPELRRVWIKLENAGVKVKLSEREALHGTEQGMDQELQAHMLRDALDYNGDPGIAVLLTGDGSGFYDGIGFHADLERMYRRKWRIEVLSWTDSCNRRMKEWAEQNGKFIALDDFYDSITFLEPPQPGRPAADPRYAVPIDLSRRPM